MLITRALQPRSIKNTNIKVTSIKTSRAQRWVGSGRQHFCGSLRSFHCLAVPIDDAHGELLGAIDITSYARPLAFDAMAMTVDVVRAAENAMFEPNGDIGRASFHVHPGRVNSNSAGMLLIDESWAVVAANRAARQMLGYTPPELENRQPD